jgi:uncharacterized protein (DUF58 family)
VQLPPSSQPGHVFTLLASLEGTQAKDATNLAPLVDELARQVRRRGLVFLLTDGLVELPGLLASLRHLRFQGHEVTLFHILHPDELGFPFEGMVEFAGVEDGRKVLTRPHLIRPAYLRALRQHLEELQAGCEANRCDYVLLDTSRPLGQSLAEYLGRRLRTRLGRSRPREGSPPEIILRTRSRERRKGNRDRP